MSDASSSAVETGTLDEISAATVPVPADHQAERVWPRPENRGWRYALLRRMLATADLTAALVATLGLGLVGSVDQLAWALVCLPAWVVLAKILGLYDRDQRSLRHLTIDEAPLLVVWAVFGAVSLSLLLHLTPAGPLHASGAIWVAAVVGISVIALRVVARRVWRAITPPERAAIIGSGTEAAAVRRKLELFPDIHVDVVDGRDNLELDGLPGETKWLSSFDRVIVATASVDERLVRELLRLGREASLKVCVVPPGRGLFGVGVGLSQLADVVLLEYNTAGPSRSTLFLKRVMDIVVSALALAVLALPMAVAAVAVKVDSRGPVFFRQLRIGQGDRPFRIFKFRSMTADAEARKDALRHLNRHGRQGSDSRMFKIDCDPRVTRVGAFLRRTSLDELPQLLNVIRGEMSLVGPRPLIPEESRYVDGWASRRLDLKPGMTGLWQVNGASAIEFEEMVRLDYVYATSCSLWMDIELIAKTIPVVWGGRNQG